MSRELRLPALDLAIPALSAMALPEYRKFSAVLEELIGADARVDLFEWAMRAVVRRHIGVRFDGKARDVVTARRLAEVKVPVQSVLSALAAVGQATGDTAAASREFAVGAGVLSGYPGMSGLAYVDPREGGGLSAVTAAVDALAGLSPKLKRPVVEACVACVKSDGEVTGGEAELLRVVIEAMGVPVPPLLPGKVG